MKIMRTMSMIMMTSAIVIMKTIPDCSIAAFPACVENAGTHNPFSEAHNRIAGLVRLG